MWSRGKISSETGAWFRIRNVFYCGFSFRSDLEKRQVKNRVRHHSEVSMNCDILISDANPLEFKEVYVRIRNADIRHYM